MQHLDRHALVARLDVERHVPAFTPAALGPDLPSNSAFPLVNGDFNGDGLDDVVYADIGAVTNRGTNEWIWHTSLNRNGVFGPPAVAASLFSTNADNVHTTPEGQRGFPFDMNQDGRMDVLYQDFSRTTQRRRFTRRPSPSELSSVTDSVFWEGCRRTRAQD